MVSEGKVHGATSVWKSLKLKAPPLGRKSPSGGPISIMTTTRPSNDAPGGNNTHPPSDAGRSNGKPRAGSDGVAVLERTQSRGDGAPAKTNDSYAESSTIPPSNQAIMLGYSKNFKSRFRPIREIARGGNGVVTLVQDIKDGTEFAMKSLPKVLSEPNVSDKKKNDHLESIKREVDVLRRLRGCLNVASLEEVYEDDTHVHIVMEYCSGGELHHRIGAAHYSERTVASFMRAVLRTIAQCHSAKILHRDIKPGNFLLSSDAEDARLKAVDFGLAAFYDERKIPRTDLGLEGTAWFMAPETLRSEVFPSSDVWSAGVMAHQLLTGRFPFNDKSNAINPSLSKVWKSIITDEVDFSRSHWEGISDEAKDFVKFLLNKDPEKRPSAKEALKHPWLKGTISERSKGKPISLAVVQRIQRYSQASLFKRSVLELIAEELLNEDEDNAGIDSPGTPERTPESCPLNERAHPVILDPSSSPLEYLYTRLKMTDTSLIDRHVFADGLKDLGYRLTPEEVDRLLDQLDPGNTGSVGKFQFAASQMDWKALQENQTERWLRCARRAFADLDADKDGVVSVEDMVALLRHKLPPSEVEGAVRHALAEASRRRDHHHDDVSNHGSANGSVHDGNHVGGSQHGIHTDGSVRNGLNFRQFVRMLHVGSCDSLEIFDDRFGSSLGSPDKMSNAASFDRLNSLLEKSVRGGGEYHRHAPLEPVQEVVE